MISQQTIRLLVLGGHSASTKPCEQQKNKQKSWRIGGPEHSKKEQMRKPRTESISKRAISKSARGSGTLSYACHASHLRTYDTFGRLGMYALPIENLSQAHEVTDESDSPRIRKRSNVFGTISALSQSATSFGMYPALCASASASLYNRAIVALAPT